MQGIYKIKNKITGKVYVGSSKDVFARWKQHKSDLKCGRHHSRLLQESWRKYGLDNHEFEILETVSNSSYLIKREHYYIKTLGLTDPEKGFNIQKASNPPDYFPTRVDFERPRIHLTETEYSRLLDMKPSGAIWAVYLCLVEFCGIGNICNLYVGDIRNKMKSKWTREQIFRSLKELQKVGLIERHRGSHGTAFTLPFRKISEEK